MRMIRSLLPFLLVFLATLAQADTRALLQLVDYVGVDYPEAVADGQVINDFEYTEMREFAGRIGEAVAAMPDSEVRSELASRAGALAEAIEGKAPPERVAALTQEIRNLIMANFDLELVPRTAPDLAEAATLYAENCAACHGAGGQGDGPLAQGMEPPPTDFHDPARARERSLYGLYNTITLGVEGTPMGSYNQLSDSQRWALAFYVGGMYASPDEASAANWRGQPLSLEQAVTLAPAELSRQLEAGGELAVYARHTPEALFASGSEALAAARDGIRRSVELLEAGDLKAAREAAITAYLEGFELTEAALSNTDAGLMREIETAMIDFRRLLDGNAELAQVEEEARRIETLLAQADAVMSDALSPGVAFTSSLIILLREGLEAILVIAAMAAFLTKTGRRQALKWLHTGWVLAVLAGAGTWVVSSYILTISGATREITEGFTALAAGAILFYVGFWMHSRANAQQWSQYIQQQMNAALGKGTLWSIAVVAFLAVYREMFETILFYQALWAQVAMNAHGAVMGGAGVAVVLLALVTLFILRYGMRLPLAKFFTITAWMMITLAVIFAGKGVAALQEAGKLPLDPVNFPRIELLGIYPNLQGLALQAVVLGLAVGLLWWQGRGARSAAA